MNPRATLAPAEPATRTGDLVRSAHNAARTAKRRLRRLSHRGLVLTLLGVVFLDLTTKGLVTWAIEPREQYGPFTSTTNARFMLGVAGAHTVTMVILMLLGVAAAAAVSARLLENRQIPPFSAGLLLGGGLANTIDRAWNGAVTDFLILGPLVVNLADLFVLLGLITAATKASRGRHLQPSQERPLRSRPWAGLTAWTR